MKQVINVTVSLEDMLQDLDFQGTNTSKIDIDTLIGKPITNGYRTIGIIDSVSEDGKYANGSLYVDADIEVLKDIRNNKMLYNAVCIK